MVTYIYFVKCPNCDDEHFDFFDEAKEFALSCLSQKPVITQTEVCRNDFGECTDSADLGTVWSWEDVMGEPDAEPAKSIFTKDDLKDYIPEEDHEFDELDNSLAYEEEALTEEEQRLATNNKGDYLVRASSGHGYTVFTRNNVCRGGLDCDTDEEAIRRFNRGDLDETFRLPVPTGMTLKDLVEEMEENEDTVECTWCEELFDKSECRKEVDLGWLCSRCEMAIKSRGETLTFREGSYWDFLDEEAKVKTWICMFDGNQIGTVEAITEEEAAEKMQRTYPEYNYSLYDGCFEVLTASNEPAEVTEVEEAEELQNLGNEYDGGYPTDSKLEELEEAADYKKRLDMCPECGAASFDHETGICINCGFNI